MKIFPKPPPIFLESGNFCNKERYTVLVNFILAHVVMVIVDDFDQKVGLGHNDNTLGFQEDFVVVGVVVEGPLSMFPENSLVDSRMVARIRMDAAGRRFHIPFQSLVYHIFYHKKQRHNYS